MESYHLAWLSAHPERTAEWLTDRLADGFHVHHIDGDHSNDDPKNLVLIEGGDHMMLHNGSSRLLWRPPGVRKNGGRRKKVKQSIEEMRQALVAAEAEAAAKAKAKKKTKAQLRYIEKRDAGRARFEASLRRSITAT